MKLTPAMVSVLRSSVSHVVCSGSSRVKPEHLETMRAHYAGQRVDRGAWYTVRKRTLDLLVTKGLVRQVATFWLELTPREVYVYRGYVASETGKEALAAIDSGRALCASFSLTAVTD